jgi:hypothetical protein
LSAIGAIDEAERGNLARHDSGTTSGSSTS